MFCFGNLFILSLYYFGSRTFLGFNAEKSFKLERVHIKSVYRFSWIILQEYHHISKKFYAAGGKIYRKDAG